MKSVDRSKLHLNDFNCLYQSVSAIIDPTIFSRIYGAVYQNNVQFTILGYSDNLNKVAM